MQKGHSSSYSLIPNLLIPRFPYYFFSFLIQIFRNICLLTSTSSNTTSDRPTFLLCKTKMPDQKSIQEPLGQPGSGELIEWRESSGNTTVDVPSPESCLPPWSCGLPSFAADCESFNPPKFLWSSAILQAALLFLHHQHHTKEPRTISASPAMNLHLDRMPHQASHGCWCSLPHSYIVYRHGAGA